MSTKSDESDDDSDEEEFLTDRKMAKEWLTEEEDSIPTGPPRTKNELLFDDSLIYDPDSVVIHNIDHDGLEANCSPVVRANTGPTAFAAEELTLIGTVMCRMDEENTLVVQAAYTQSPLNEGSLLCFQEGIVLGKICEIFGPITTPFYVVKWATLPASTSSKSNVPSKNKEESNFNKKKKNKRGSGHSKAAKKEELASIDDNSLEQAEENGDTLPEKEITIDEKDCADLAELSASSETLPVDAADAMVVTEIAVAEQVNCEESEEIVAVEETVQPATTTSTAQAEYFAILMRRALPGTTVYSSAKHTVVITASSLSALRKQSKGTDASNIYDEEIADDEKEYSDDEEELLAKQEKNRAKRTLDPTGKPKLVAQTGGRSAYVSGADSTGTGTGTSTSRTTARPSHSAPSSNTHYQQPQQQSQQQQRNQAQPYAARNNNNVGSSNTSQPQQSQHQGLMYSNQPPQQYQNRVEPPLYSQQQQQQQQQYPGHYGQPQHGNYMPGIAHPMQGFDQTLHGNFPPMGMGYGHPPQPSGSSYPPRGGPRESQGEYLSNYAAPQPMGGVHMQQQYGMPQQYQQQQHKQQQQPPYYFPTHIQAVPQGQSVGAPWPGFGVSPNGSGNGAGLGAGTAGSTGKLPAYVHQPIQFNTKMP